MVKGIIRSIIASAFDKLNLENNDKFNVEVPNNPLHGDYATNAAMVLAKLNHKRPNELAQALKKQLEKDKKIAKVEIAGPGFINITLDVSLYQELLYEILKAKEQYGASEHGKDKTVLLEFVSANPTGPLNIVSARAATYGDTLYRILTKVGFEVKREFYVNDAGNQVDILAESLELRLRQVRGENIGDFPIDAYHGDYLIQMASELNITEGSRLLMLPERDRIESLTEYALDVIHEMQVESLEKIGCEFENWVSEKKLREQGIVEEVLSFLAEAECTYEKDDAIWFSSTKFGDDKDRVLMKADGTITYFVPDLAYHLTKYQRGFDYIIDVLGPDHHGYVPRLRAAIEALKYDRNKLEIIFLQQINLFEDGEKIKMSKRLGKIITMDDLINEVGKDVVRFFFIDRKTNAHLNFDMDLAKKESEENPVYYIQYAHARISSILKKARKDHDIRIGKPSRSAIACLKEDEEINMMKQMIAFPQLLVDIADTREPHRLAIYVYELAGMVHKFYGKHKVIDITDSETTKGRLFLMTAAKSVIAIALDLIGVSAPDKMKSKGTTPKKEQKSTKGDIETIMGNAIKKRKLLQEPMSMEEETEDSVEYEEAEEKPKTAKPKKKTTTSSSAKLPEPEDLVLKSKEKITTRKTKIVAEPEKAEPKKIEPKKAEPKKTESKKVEPKKVEPKKPAPKKVEPKKAESKKAAPKKVEPKKAEPKKKPAPKKTVAKETETKAPTKSSTKKKTTDK
ncbi:MAG: arginine--tRNA ligase [Candidatus Cloacimonadales bacterium]